MKNVLLVTVWEDLCFGLDMWVVFIRKKLEKNSNVDKTFVFGNVQVWRLYLDALIFYEFLNPTCRAKITLVAKKKSYLAPNITKLSIPKNFENIS